MRYIDTHPILRIFVMGSDDAFRLRSKYCPYCGSKVLRDDNYCVVCRRTFVDPLVEDSSPTVQQHEYTKWKKPWVSAFLSFIGIGLGQFYNGDTIKGLILLSSFIAVLYGFLLFLPTALFIPVIMFWVAAIPDAYLSAEEINTLQKPFRKKSVFFWVEIIVLISIVVVSALPVVSPQTTARGIAMAAHVMTTAKVPMLPFMDYDTALAYAPNDTEIMIEKVNFLVATGKYDDAQVLLDHLILALPNDTAPVIMAGDLLYGRGKFEESLNYYDRALTMTPKDAQVWIKKGDVYLAMSVGDMQKIRERYKGLTSTVKNPASSSDASTMDAFRETGSYRQAVKSYYEAMKIDPMTSVEISGRVLASTQTLLDNYEGILDDINNGDTVSNRTGME